MYLPGVVRRRGAPGRERRGGTVPHGTATACQAGRQTRVRPAAHQARRPHVHQPAAHGDQGAMVEAAAELRRVRVDDGVRGAPPAQSSLTRRQEGGGVARPAHHQGRGPDEGHGRGAEGMAGGARGRLRFAADAGGGCGVRRGEDPVHQHQAHGPVRAGHDAGSLRRQGSYVIKWYQGRGEGQDERVHVSQPGHELSATDRADEVVGRGSRGEDRGTGRVGTTYTGGGEGFGARAERGQAKTATRRGSPGAQRRQGW